MNTSFLIHPAKAQFLSGPTEVYIGEDANFQWYVQYTEYRGLHGFSVPNSQIYSRHQGDLDWTYEGSNSGGGWKYFDMPLNKLGLWEFKVEIWVASGSNHNSYNTLMQTQALANIQCLCPENMEIDVKIAYDDLAIQSLDSDFDLSINEVPELVEYALDIYHINNFMEMILNSIPVMIQIG